MRLALVFSGQGGLQASHVERLRTTAPAALQRLLSEPLAAVGTEPNVLTLNRYAQPLIFGLQTLWWEALRNHLPRPIAAAGYSLGEMGACWAAGLFSLEQGVLLCNRRARHMDAVGGEGAMVAVLGLGDEDVLAIAKATGAAVAIRNGPFHLVLAGPPDSIAAAISLANARGATRVIPLPVTTASHTERLAPAGTAFAMDLAAAMSDVRLAFPVLSAIDGRPARSAAQAADGLARQLSQPLDWEACMIQLLEMQPSAVLEIGPGNALCRLLAELAPELPARSCDDFRGVSGIIDWVLAHA